MDFYFLIYQNQLSTCLNVWSMSQYELLQRGKELNDNMNRRSIVICLSNNS